MSAPPRWLLWARELQALAQTGLAFNDNPYDVHRYQRIMRIAAEMISEQSAADAETLLEGFLTQPGYATPKVDVRAAVVREGRILLVKEISDGLWCMPGGWADVGESPAEMVVRETEEESGFVVKPTKLVGVFDANRDNDALELFHAYKLVFLCDLLGGEPRVSNETSAVDFFAFDDLPPLSSNRTNARHLEEVRAHLDDAARMAFFE